MGYMFRLFISYPQAHFCQLSHKMLCTLRDPIVHDEWTDFTSTTNTSKLRPALITNMAYFKSGTIWSAHTRRLGVSLPSFVCWDCRFEPCRGMDVCLLWVLCVFVRGWVDPTATVRPEVSHQWKFPMTSSGIEPATFQLVAQCRHVPPDILSIYTNS